MSANRTYTHEDLARREQTRYQLILEAVHKFRFFFVGLVFAILSFAIQFPVRSGNSWVKLIEASSWLVLAATGYLALKDCGGFSPKVTEKVIEGLESKPRALMWGLFLAGVLLLLGAKIIDSFLLST